MNEYPVVLEEQEKNDERLSVYRNYKSSVKSIIIKALLMGLFLFFSVKLIISVIMNTPQIGYNLGQIAAKYEYILEGVPVTYMMNSVDLVYGLIIDYILLFCCVINTLWLGAGVFYGISSLKMSDEPGAFNLWYIRVKRRAVLFVLRWNIVSAIVMVILRISKSVIF